MEGTTAPDFMRLSEDVARRFLHTVVVVEDNAYFGEKILPSPLQSPGRGKPVKGGKEEVGRKHFELNAKAVIDSFAAKGIVCAFLKPIADEEFTLFKKVSRRTDAFILDWEIGGDDGRTAKKTISEIIKSDLREKPRLRLLLIYTIENDVYSISEAIREELKSVFAERCKSEDNDATLTYGYLRIAIFLKDSLNVAPEYEDRVLNIEELAGRLHMEFAKITAGLVSNIALESMSILRDNTHQILGRLGPDIDPPYLAHRALLPHPEDAKGHALGIISSEFHSLLENSNVGEMADIDAIMSWLEMKNDSAHFKVKVGTTYKKMNFDEMKDAMEKGIENTNWYDSCGKRIRTTIYKNLTTTFCFDGEDGPESDRKYSLLTTLKQKYEGDRYIPKLTLGTIVKTSYTSKYWFCIQPRCDSVRIEKERNFFFLPLDIVGDGNDKKFDLVIDKGKNDFVKLKIKYSVSDIAKFTFRLVNESHQEIKAKKVNKYLIFKPIEGANFIYIAELKTEQSQRVANNFASELSRVGLDEYEWLRRWAK